MKKLFLILILLTSIILLSGCGIFNLNTFITPDDTEFLALVQELDTPEKIGNYMEENFEYEYHSFYALTPYELFLNKKGDCNDFSAFSVFIANYHGYETYQIKIFDNTIIRHWIAVYSENNGFSITDNQDYFSGYPSIIDNQLCFPNFNSFEQIVEFDSLRKNKVWTKYIVYDYDMNIIEQATK